jgi:uncharacterized protein DUF4258
LVRASMTSSPDILRKVREYVRNGKYIFTKHAVERQEERGIKLSDVLHVLEHGRHEHDKDIFDIKSQCWKYAIRGTTMVGTDIRAIVTFEKNMVIITLIKVK